MTDELKNTLKEIADAEVAYWEGFDACLEMVINIFDSTADALPKEFLKEEIIEEAELYKKDG